MAWFSYLTFVGKDIGCLVKQSPDSKTTGFDAGSISIRYTKRQIDIEQTSTQVVSLFGLLFLEYFSKHYTRHYNVVSGPVISLVSEGILLQVILVRIDKTFHWLILTSILWLVLSKISFSLKLLSCK